MVEVHDNTRGIATGGLTTGIIGTALGAMNSGILPGLFGGNAAACSENMGVNRYELSMVRELTNKDMEIAYLKGWINKDKLLESAEKYGKSPYGQHLKRVAEGKIQY